MPKIKVTYWRGTQQLEGTADSYEGAMELASRNENAYTPRFFDANGVRLHDLGECLAYEPDEAGNVIVYA